jgi:iron(III) transport system ATP-binding protein
VPDAALVCRGIRKSFGDVVALAGLDLSVAPGSLTALLGPSGCGKTTALRVIAGLEDPDAGTLEVGGRVLVDADTNVPPERRRIGLVFQDYALFPHLTVGQNVAYGLQDVPARERGGRVAEALALVGLSGLEPRLPTQLSGGQQQRVALARALAPRPALVLLDEPFSNLDAGLRIQVREEVRSILDAARATALFVTHEQEEALSLADEVAVMDAGRLHQVADPQTLYTRPATRFVAEFVGEADLIPGTRAGRHFVDTSLGRLQTREPMTADQVTVVLRPEAVALSRDDDGPGVVDAIQYFGHDQLVAVRLPGGDQVRVRSGPGLAVARGDRVALGVADAVIAFDEPDVDLARQSVPSPA